jgi:hypothetical protein
MFNEIPRHLNRTKLIFSPPIHTQNFRCTTHSFVTPIYDAAHYSEGLLKAQ